MKSYTINNVKDFNLDHIFDCGQCFRWTKKEDGSYDGIAMGRVVNMQFVEEGEDARQSVREESEDARQPVREKIDNPHSPGTLTITGSDERDFQNIWRPYLDLDRDYGAIKSKLCATDPIMKKAADFGYGIRLLDQDLWETIVSFIISQNNNIPRIKGCIERLAKGFGSEIAESVYDIPRPEELARLAEADLAEVRLGYRARYLVETARCVCDKGLPENEEQLLSLCGIGPKVANCIMLFGMAKYDSFPIDVWVRRVMHRLYGIDENDKKAMTAYAKERFGELGGFAQQYLFYYMRSIAE